MLFILALPFAVLFIIVALIDQLSTRPPHDSGPPPAAPSSHPDWVWVPGHRRGRRYVKGYWRRIR